MSTSIYIDLQSPPLFGQLKETLLLQDTPPLFLIKTLIYRRLSLNVSPLRTALKSEIVW